MIRLKEPPNGDSGGSRNSNLTGADRTFTNEPLHSSMRLGGAQYMNHSSKSVQTHLNLTLREDLFAADLRTEQISEIVEIVAGQKLSAEEIYERSMNGSFQIEYAHGVLIITHTAKRDHWNLSLCPASLMDAST